MKIRLRGHVIAWHKPINLASLLRVVAIAAMFASLVAGSSRGWAGEASARGGAGLSPAMALAIALGVRSVQGPVVHSAPSVTKSHPPARQAMLLPSDRGSTAQFVVPASHAVRKAAP